MKWLVNIHIDVLRSKYPVWFEAHSVGPPIPSVRYTVQQLQHMGVVGVYERNPNAGSMSLAVFLAGIFAMLIIAAAVVAIWWWF